MIKNYKNFFDEHPHSINGTVNVIWLASVDGSIDQLKMLLEHSNKGINETSKKFQSTALHEATGKGKTEHVKLLLE